MGAICVKKQQDPQVKNPNSNTIKNKMDIQQYKRLQIIKQSLNNETKLSQNLYKQNTSQKRQINDFKFIRQLGNGAYGQVLMVKDLKSQKFYAMKIIKKQLIIEREQILNALSERYILAAMDHPFVVKLYYAFQTKNKIYLIVDLMSGGQMYFLLRKNKKFTEEITKFYAAQIVLALEYLHSKKIIYRDLKPQNILLTHDGHIKLTDFGLSKVCLKKNQLALSICGTPQYIAPQVLKGKGYTIVADWFSFGSLIYDMLTGKPPFYSKNKQEMMLKIQTKQIPFPQYLSQEAISLLKGLFEKKQQNRLGYKNDALQIKAHPFFKSINFDDILNKKIKPPFQFGSSADKLNMAGFITKEDQFSVQESFQNQLVQQSKGINFQGFTYQVNGMRNQRNETKAQMSFNKSYLPKQLQGQQKQINSPQNRKTPKRQSELTSVEKIKQKTPLQQIRSSISQSLNNSSNLKSNNHIQVNENNINQSVENSPIKYSTNNSPVKFIHKDNGNVSFGTIAEQN